MRKSFKDILMILFFVTIGVFTRIIWHVGPNIEFVTAVSIIAGYLLKSRSFLVPLMILMITDIIIGNTIIFLFTWSAFLLAPILGIIVHKVQNKFAKNNISKLFIGLIGTEAVGIFFTILFFLWTNLGVVLTTNMYPKTFDGLIQSYINALPFLRNQLIGNGEFLSGNIFFVPIIFIASLLLFTFMNSFSNLNSKVKMQCHQLV